MEQHYPDREPAWVKCPVCRGKTRIRIFPDTVLINFPLYCPCCKKETVVTIINQQLTRSSEPDA
ncbi:MAG: cysteine-rich KTR domain-containing protein [Eubacteriales bacterium]|nr:cysteine-rich KTR domain-containing protein [Eubacteriales bacterium]